MATDIERLVSGDSSSSADTSDPLRKLNDEIGIVQRKLDDLNDPRFEDQFGEKELKVSLENLLAKLTSQRDELRDIHGVADAEFLVELQRLFGDSTSQSQDLTSAMADLCTCLREVCTRIDELAPLSPVGARSGGVGFDGDGAGVGAGGGIIPVSFTVGAGFDLFNRELEVAGGIAGETGLYIAKLAERAGGARAEFGSFAKVLRANNILFTDQVGTIGLLETLLPELGTAMTGAFTEASEAGGDLDRVTEVLGGTLIEAFKGAAFEGKSFRDVLLLIIKDILVISQSSLGGGSSGGGGGFLGTLLNSALGAIGGSLFGGGGSIPPIPRRRPSVPITIEAAKGGAFLRGDTMTTALAQGGVLHNSVVSRPTLFAMAKGYGLMGEAGPEAVMPLTRLPNGELGVKGMAGGGSAAPAGPSVVYNIDARGADQQAIRELTLAVRQQRADLNFVNRTLERRAVNAVAERRRRGPF